MVGAATSRLHARRSSGVRARHSWQGPPEDAALRQHLHGRQLEARDRSGVASRASAWEQQAPPLSGRAERRGERVQRPAAVCRDSAQSHQGPSLPGDTRRAVRVPDHRAATMWSGGPQEVCGAPREGRASGPWEESNTEGESSRGALVGLWWLERWAKRGKVVASRPCSEAGRGGGTRGW